MVERTHKIVVYISLFVTMANPSIQVERSNLLDLISYNSMNYVE